MEKNSGASRHLKDAVKICTGVDKKNREEIGMFLFEDGEKIGSFGQNIYPCVSKNVRLLVTIVELFSLFGKNHPDLLERRIILTYWTVCRTFQLFQAFCRTQTLLGRTPFDVF